MLMNFYCPVFFFFSFFFLIYLFLHVCIFIYISLLSSVIQIVTVLVINMIHSPNCSVNQLINMIHSPNCSVNQQHGIVFMKEEVNELRHSRFIINSPPPTT